MDQNKGSSTLSQVVANLTCQEVSQAEHGNKYHLLCLQSTGMVLLNGQKEWLPQLPYLEHPQRLAVTSSQRKGTEKKRSLPLCPSCLRLGWLAPSGYDGLYPLCMRQSSLLSWTSKQEAVVLILRSHPGL